MLINTAGVEVMPINTAGVEISLESSKDIGVGMILGGVSNHSNAFMLHPLEDQRGLLIGDYSLEFIPNFEQREARQLRHQVSEIETESDKQRDKEED